MPLYLITGGAGFIGSHIAEWLIAGGNQVRVYDDFSTGRRENLAGIKGPLEIVEGDIRDLRALTHAAQGADFVLHQAARVSVIESIENPELAVDVNIRGTLNVLMAARDVKAQRVVLASSCAVYGDGPVPAKETQPTNPLSPYAASKLACEGLAVSFYRSFGLATVCLRYFNVFGPRQRPDSPYAGVIAIFSDRLSMRQPIRIFGDGKQSRDFIYVEDVAKANLLACHAERAVGGVWNIGTGKGRNLLEITGEIGALLGRKPEVIFEEAREGEILHSRADTARTKKGLEFKACTEVRDGLHRTLAWYATQG